MLWTPNKSCYTRNNLKHPRNDVGVTARDRGTLCHITWFSGFDFTCSCNRPSIQKCENFEWVFIIQPQVGRFLTPFLNRGRSMNWLQLPGDQEAVETLSFFIQPRLVWRRTKSWRQFDAHSIILTENLKREEQSTSDILPTSLLLYWFNENKIKNFSCSPKMKCSSTTVTYVLWRNLINRATNWYYIHHIFRI